VKIIKLPFNVKRKILACGADMKGAFALADGPEAYLFDGFGDLGDPRNLERYEKAVARETKRSGIKPAIIACDLHPGYFSTQFAERAQGTERRARICRIQHHEAHVAAAIVDNAIEGNVIGAAFDGTGYGADGNIWGGEFFVVRSPMSVGRCGFTRVAHLAYVPMPGGEAAIREPYRMALAYLHSAFKRNTARLDLEFFKRGLAPFKKIFNKLLDGRINSPLTSSAGRLFDAVGSIVLEKKTVETEAELPIGLEKIALELCLEAYDFDIKKAGGMMEIDCRRMIKGVVKDMSGRSDRAIVSSRFHNTAAQIVLRVSEILRKKYGINKVALSGGVFQNAFLSARVKGLLSKGGFRVFAHSKIPANDYGIPIGQIAIANARRRDAGGQVRAGCV
jgi:hydrogenase maturation protein HypF